MFTKPLLKKIKIDKKEMKFLLLFLLALVRLDLSHCGGELYPWGPHNGDAVLIQPNFSPLSGLPITENMLLNGYLEGQRVNLTLSHFKLFNMSYDALYIHKVGVIGFKSGKFLLTTLWFVDVCLSVFNKYGSNFK